MVNNRLKEWKDDEEAEIVNKTSKLFRQVVRRCQLSVVDRDFFPGNFLHVRQNNSNVSKHVEKLDHHPSDLDFDINRNDFMETSSHYTFSDENWFPWMLATQGSEAPLPSEKEFMEEHINAFSNTIKMVSDDLNSNRVTNTGCCTTEVGGCCDGSYATANSPAVISVHYITWDDVFMHLQRYFDALTENLNSSNYFLYRIFDDVAARVDDAIAFWSQFLQSHVKISRIYIQRRSTLRWYVTLQQIDTKEIIKVNMLEVDLTNL